MDRDQSQNQPMVFILESTDFSTIYIRLYTKNDAIGFILSFLHSDTMAV
jgi:hypothetical protein